MTRALLARPRRAINAIRSSIAESFRRRFALRLTIEGWCIVATMMLIGLAALNTAAPLLYLMFSMMCSFFVLSAMLATNSIRALGLTRYAPRVWQAQSPMRVEVRIRNGKRFTSSYSLRVLDRMKDGTALGSVFFDVVPSRCGEVAQEYECLFLIRGVYRLEGFELATRFPFGLIERRLSWDDPWEILVMPQTIKVGAHLERARVTMGDHQSHQRGAGSGLYGLRAYTREQSARDIHWKVSARRGGLIAREYESEEKRRASVVLDNRRAGRETPAMREAFERAVVLAASVLDWLCSQQHEVELRTASGVIAYGSGVPHLTRCKRSLASLELIEGGVAEAGILAPSGEDSIAFPILMGAPEGRSEGRFPLSIEEFADQLSAAFIPHDEAAAAIPGVTAAAP